MSELEELIKQIGELRINLIRTKRGKAYTDPEVVVVSQELSTVLGKYRELVDK